MRRSDVLLFPSLRDGGGAVVVEAMACGLPVVCLDVGGPGFHVREGVGTKVGPGRPDAVAAELAAALGRFWCDPGLRDRLGRLGERLRGIYEDALAGRPPRREGPP